MNVPQPLVAGDLIYITAPAKAIEKEHVDFAISFFENAGYKVLVSKNCLGQHHYFSGTDEERLEDLQYGIDHPEVKAIVCARGGYGCVRIVDRIQWASMLREPKWMVGFSDVTVFHQHLQRFNLPSIHGSMVLNFKDNTQEALTTLLSALKGESFSLSATSTQNKPGQAEGTLIGGNLSIVYSLIGTNNQPDYSDKILFVEDLAEHLYHIDRMFYALNKSGILDKINGLVVGGMTELEDTATPFGMSVEEIILAHFKYRNIPVAFGFPAGHLSDNRALILGKKVRFNVEGTTSELRFL
ncbi:MAG: LD-carboxypeptidase [Flavobacteriia bacterium]|jgi:muramoyltetrapeptide carboxypeptidase